MMRLYSPSTLAAASRAISPVCLDNIIYNEFIIPGPNFIQFINNYYKLRFAGIKIYTSIDIYV
jgi:hypothetical protein